MNIRILLTTIVLFFLFQLTQAQDTLKHAGKHTHKTHVSDTNKVAHSSHASRVKDTAEIRREHLLKVSMYPRDGYVALTVGMGLPLAAYSSNEGAGMGSVTSISAAFPGVISHCGIAFKFDYGVNFLNKSRVEGIQNNIAGFGNINCTLADTFGHCSYSAFLTGLYLTYPKKNYTIDFRMLFGAMIARVPALGVMYTDNSNGNTASYVIAGSSASAFAFDFGFEARYPINRRFIILLSGDYLHVVPAFTIVRTGATLTSYGSIVPSDGSGQETTMDKPFNVFSLSLGIGYPISAKKPATPKVN